MIDGPDFAGFADAQVRLRANFGREVVFFTPLPTTWPPGTPLDPESGRPFDPTIRPIASGMASAAVNCSIIDRPLGLSQRGTKDQRQAQTAIGDMADKNKVAIISVEDAPRASGAVKASYLDEDFRVTDFRRDALGPVERYLAYLESL